MPAVTVVLTIQPEAASDLARSALSVTRQLSADWQLRIVHGGDPGAAAAGELLAARDERVAGAADLAAALADSDGAIVAFLETGARYPADYLTAVLAAMADPAVRLTVAGRAFEHGPRFSVVSVAGPDDPAAPVVPSQVAVRRADAARRIEELLGLPGRRDLPDVVVHTRFGEPAARESAELTVVLELSTASPPLSLRPAVAELAGFGLPVVLAVAGPIRAVKGPLRRWLQQPGAPVASGATPSAARVAAMRLVSTPMVCFLPAGWECDPAALAAMADLVVQRQAAAAVPVALDEGGSVLAAGLLWADRHALAQPLLAGHPGADIVGRVLPVPSAHPYGLTMRTDDARAGLPAAVAPAPWWPVQLLAGRGPVLVDGRCTVAIPRLTPPGAAGARTLDDSQAEAIRSAAPPGAVSLGRDFLHASGWSVLGVRPAAGHGWQPVLARVRTEPVAERRWALKIGAPAGRRGDPWGDVFFADDLAAALRALGNDVVVDRDGSAGRSGAYLDRVVLNLRGYQVLPRQPGAVNLLWIISHPDDVPAQEMRTYDIVYAASASWPAAVSAASGVQVRTLLQATNPDRFHPDVAEPDTGPDLLFVGNSRHQFRPIVADCRAAGLRPTVIGRDWEKFLPQEEIAAQSVPNSELPAAYRSAGIVLNDHWGDMASHGFLNNRLFDAVACGARVVSDEVPGLAEVFGDAVAIYRSPGDLAALCSPAHRQQFGSDEVRRARAAVVAENHSFAARARQLMADAALVEVLSD